jgi:hypothetical protein
MKLRWVFIFSVIIFSVCWFCQPTSTPAEFSLLNFSHLEHLTQEIRMNGRTVSMVKIYADYPDYQTVEAAGEGIACVDDVARAAVLYLRHYRYTENKKSLQQARKMLHFILEMQASNGLFYNFILDDYSINRERENSQPTASWWAWRAIWAMAEGITVFEPISPSFTDTLVTQIEKTFSAIDSLLRPFPQTVRKASLDLPQWLPYGSAADQAAVIIIALNSYLNSTGKLEVKDYLQKLAEGILKMQYGDSLHFPYGCFLSWENQWHAYGNSQAYALLLAGNISVKDLFVKKALMEVDHFYPFLLKAGILNAFAIHPQENSYMISDRQDFSQIAYGIRPLVWACLEANRVIGEQKYAELAGEIACWLLGKNAARQSMYDPHTGRCFDGINDQENINKNSGAESTIEALLILLEIEQNPAARRIVHDYYQATINKK